MNVPIGTRVFAANLILQNYECLSEFKLFMEINEILRNIKCSIHLSFKHLLFPSRIFFFVQISIEDLMLFSKIYPLHHTEQRVTLSHIFDSFLNTKE